jgi:hypothetical protein
MNRFESQFDAKHVLMAVLHPATAGEALAAAHALHDLGVSAAFITHRHVSEPEALAIVRKIHDVLPDLWVGVQIRGRPAADALTSAVAACGRRLDGLWTDAFAPGDDLIDRAFEDARRRLLWTGLHFATASLDALFAVPAERFDVTVRLAGVGCDVLCVAGGPAAPGEPSRLEKLRAVRASLGSHATLGVDSGSSSELAALRQVAGAFLVELATAGGGDLTALEAMLRELADAPPATSWFPRRAIRAERADDTRRLRTGDWRQDAAYPEPLWAATAPALARRVSIENGSGLYALLLVDHEADPRIEHLLAAARIGASPAYRVAVAESSNPVEDGFARRIVIWQPRHSPRQPIDVLTLVREFIAAERERIGDVEPWLRTQYEGRETGGTLFVWIDYPGFDNGTMVFGAAVMIHGAELHVWSRPVHAHK